MKLLYVENTLAIHGGIERVLTDKLNWLVENGNCEVCLLLVNQGSHPIVFSLNPKVECRDLGIMFHQIYRYSGLKRYRMFFKLHQLFRCRIAEQMQELSPEIIVCTRLELVYDVIKVSDRIPVVYESHNSFLAYKFEKYSLAQKLWIKIIHHTLRKAQMIVSLTQGDALEWKKINPHVQVIPNVVHLNDLGRYSDCCSKSVIFVGRYSYQKDLETLLHIWELVCKRHPEWVLHIFDGYGFQQELLPTIYRMDAKVVLHQPTSAIFEEYLNNSMLLMTSIFEPFGLVLPEAMSCGLPVVAFDCPYGPAEIISDGKDGLLVKNRSVDDFANRVCMLIENQDLRRKMGIAGIMSSQKYCACNIMPQWIKLFEQLYINN